LHELGHGREGLGNMGIDLRLIAGGVGALCGIWKIANLFCWPLAAVPPRERAQLHQVPEKMLHLDSASDCLHNQRVRGSRSATALPKFTLPIRLDFYSDSDISSSE